MVQKWTSKCSDSKIQCTTVHGVEYHPGKWVSIKFDSKYTKKPNFKSQSHKLVWECHNLKVLYSPGETELIELDLWFMVILLTIHYIFYCKEMQVFENMSLYILATQDCCKWWIMMKNSSEWVTVFKKELLCCPSFLAAKNKCKNDHCCGLIFYEDTNPINPKTCISLHP